MYKNSQLRKMNQTTINMQPEKIKTVPLLATSEPEAAVSNFLIWSILNNICCICTCGLTLICSIPALVFSINVDSGQKQGNKEMAKRNSILAFIMNTTTVVSITIIFIVSFIFWVYVVYYSAKGVEWFCDLPLNWTC